VWTLGLDWYLDFTRLRFLYELLLPDHASRAVEKQSLLPSFLACGRRGEARGVGTGLFVLFFLVLLAWWYPYWPGISLLKIPKTLPASLYMFL
jgi:hypothetical protein